MLAITNENYGNNHIEEYMVIDADTIVVTEDEILWKPTDETGAVRMLSKLSGNSQYVYTGVTVAYVKHGNTLKHSSEYNLFELTSTASPA